MVFASFSFRLRVEVEALNMVEALGAYGRHRTVSILKPRPDGRGYRVVIAPAVSGQAIAYGYMKTLVALADKLGLPVCNECRNYATLGGFTKHGTSEEKGLTEHALVANCLVEDLTGFMVPAAGIRRTSPVQFSYMVPDVESSDVAIDPQFHVRAPMPGQSPQPFQVEAGTAVYTLSVFIDCDKIGTTSDGKPVNDRGKRVEAALLGLSVLLEGLAFGAKKARYLPVYEVSGAVAAVSRPLPFVVSPARVTKNSNYIRDTIDRAAKYTELLRDLKERVDIVYFDKEGLLPEAPSGVKKVNSLPELVDEVKRLVLEASQKGGR
jgi:CRISPR-associated protein Csa2